MNSYTPPPDDVNGEENDSKLQNNVGSILLAVVLIVVALILFFGKLLNEQAILLPTKTKPAFVESTTSESKGNLTCDRFHYY